MSENKIVSNIYHLRENFAIIGLTGRTGSGCTTIAKLFSDSEFENLHARQPSEEYEGITNDERKYKIVYNFAKANWQKFTVITASDIIFYFVLSLSFEDFIKSVAESENKKAMQDSNILESLYNIFKPLKDRFEADSKMVSEIDDFLTKRQSYFLRYDRNSSNCESVIKIINKYKDFLFNEIPELRKEISKLYGKKMFRIYQAWGNNIRQYGSAKAQENTNEEISTIARKINAIIKMLEDENIYEKKPTFIVIDAIRNPYEVLYFKERYAAFYLMSITTDNKIRKNNLYNMDYRDSEIAELDTEEYPNKSKALNKSYVEQDIQKCVELSDIFVYNNGKNTEDNVELKEQLIKFFSLVLHPGLVTPSPLERAMQVAYVAKMNSGCVSRQVGAAVTNEGYSIKSIGWNTVPQGQTPCDLCCFEDLIKKNDKNAYSDYELEDEEFRKFLNSAYDEYKKSEYSLKGLPHSFCFKDFYTTMKNQKNQVYTRSLHAEENAFLQLAKYGSVGVENGKLFTTASPCELCAKKAYQLGIKEIYYIDIYPGITEKHILGNGIRRPKTYFFHGAIGRAYDSLYNPLIMMKDEITELTSVDVKSIRKESSSKNQEDKSYGINSKN